MAIDLNDRKALEQQDPKGMLGLVEGFPDQCRQALEIAKSVTFPTLERRPSLVVLTGMGGSAAGGDFLKALMEAQGAAPFVVNRDYHIPNYVGMGDLVFCASYSGNTEETLSAYGEAKRAGAKVIAITSGGALRELAEKAGDTVCVVPGGQPPRTALGYMLVPALVACERLKLLHAQDYEEAFSQLDKVREALSPESAKNEAQQIASDLRGALGVIYGLGPWQGAIANRWKGQINENAKCVALANGFPELNHNEILGWVGASQQGARFVGVLLESGAESEKMAARARVTEKLLESTVRFHHVRALGNSLLSQMLSLAYQGDYVSLYLAFLNGVDPENIASIDTLKNELAKIP